jgi:hypothetical protein
MTEIARLLPALALAAALAPLGAAAQLYKCKGPDGKTVYSDSKCEASEAGALKVTPMSTTPSAREKAAAEAAKEAAAAKAAPGSTLSGAAPAGEAPGASTVTRSVGSASAGYRLTASDEERLRNLEVGRTRLGATAEQKSAMDLEMRHIRSGRDARLSSEDRARREALHSDLMSSDAQKRRKALSDFRALYN